MSTRHRSFRERHGNLSFFLLFLMGLALLVAAVAWWRLTRPAPAPYGEITRLPGTARPSDRPPITAGRSLETMDREFTELVDHVIPSVVSISTDTITAPDRQALLRQFFGLTSGPLRPQVQTQVGSGMIVSPEGHIVTNWHVVKGAARVTVQLSDGRSLPAQLAGADQRSDIAVLKVEGDGLSAIDFGDSEHVRVGQMVFAVGNPFGLQETVTQGIISAKGRRTTSEAANEFFQTSAVINPGNSGGPLVDIHGKVIGINNFILSHSGGSEGIGFSIPSNVAKRAYQDIIQRGHVVHPWLGVVMRPLNAALARQLGLTSPAGALVAATMSGSPADQAGLAAGDVIVSFNGTPVRDVNDLRIRVAETEIGSQVKLGIHREGQPLDVTLTIQEEPER